MSILLCTIVCIAWGQMDPLFSVKLAFVDAAGNRDTVQIGFDTSANEFYNPKYGEVDLQNPFDKAFEVRAAHHSILTGSVAKGILSKKIITYAEEVFRIPDPGTICHNGSKILLFMKTKNFPVTMLWDSLDFLNTRECLSQSYVTPDYNSELVDPFYVWIDFPGKRFSCLTSSNHFNIHLDPVYTREHFPKEYTYRIVKEFSPGNFDTLYAIAINFIHDELVSPCRVFVDQEDYSEKASGFLVFPNPATDEISFQCIPDMECDWIQIHDLLGRKIRKINKVDRENRIEIRDLSPGYYMLVSGKGNEFQAVGKFMKL